MANGPDLLKTFRYVRVIIVAMSIGLLVAVGIERHRADCTLGSISAYYYSPARGFFVGGLIAIGVCLIAIRDNDNVKDGLLNVAGVFGPMVALVPMNLKILENGRKTREAACIEGGSHRGGDGGTPLRIAGREDAIFNNFTTLVVILAATLAFLGAMLWLRPEGDLTARRWTPWLVAVAGLALLVAAYQSPEFFLTKVHYLSAFLLFGLVAIYAVLDGRDALCQQGARKRGIAYIALGLGIVIGCLAIKVIGESVDWHYTTLAVELWGIVFFLVFWIIQTADLWDHTTRQAAIASTTP